MTTDAQPENRIPMAPF